ncbi:AmiR/NasT family two-component response regulator [Pararhizobium capsulatum DSM 1112]|uniref:AmiR/NasT family two-component response regulator n=1 Tax=Pararhizobium capsulatum DSM 1112 TaxID=1121113 RepID=A0ABU0BX53_9HYPH|nr:ANTAR domain-containing protein [Pararhizobium capsulatum]MDQ0322845.1 AmiR/NasT family two-component response regulator [Pararhizobium capsulatum DSM 1112]
MINTPNFAGWRVAILAEEDANTDRLRRQLTLLGVASALQWLPLLPLDLPELVIVDADRGWDELLPWPEGKPARPVVALLGSEAPGRIAWAIGCGASAIIPKPVSASTIYPALVLAVASHQRRMEAEAQVAKLEERLRLRPVVFAAINRLKTERRIDDEQAYRLLRECAMQRRMPMEQLAALFLGSSKALKDVG